MLTEWVWPALGKARRQCNGGIVDPTQSLSKLKDRAQWGLIKRESGRDRGSERCRKRGRRPNEELAVPEQSLRSKRDEECDGLAGNEKDHQHRCNNGRRSGVQSNTERTVIGVGIDGVNVCYLDEGKESQQGQAEYNDDSPGIGHPVPIATRPWVKSSQSNVYLELRFRF